MKIVTDPAEIAANLRLYQKDEEPYIVNRLSQVCLGKLVELIMRNKFGDPLVLLPFQRVILYMLWNKKFPMLIGARGLSKTFLLAVYSLLKALIVPGSKIVIVSGGFRQAKLVMNYIDDILKASPILQEAIFKFHPGSDYGVKYAVDKAYLKVSNNTEIIALPLGDGCIAGDSLVTTAHGICTMNAICENLQIEKQIDNENLMVWGNSKFRLSDSKINNGVQDTLKISTSCNYVIEGTFNHKIKVLRNGVEWCRFDELKIGDKVPIDVSERWHGGVDVGSEKECYSLGVALADEANGFFDQDYWLKFWEVSEDKSLPNLILRGSKKNMAACLEGLFRASSSLKTNGEDFYVELKNNSNKLLRQIQYILLHFGIISTLQDKILIIHQNYFEEFTNRIHKNVVYIEPKSSTYYDEIVSIERGRCQTYDIHVPEDNEYCANGFFSHNSRIRGFRASTLILDETASVSEQVFDTAVAPFLSVNANPAENVMLNSFVERLRKLGAKNKVIRLVERQLNYNGNQLILAGTASFQFNHFFKRYQSYRLIATSNGDREYIKDGLQQMALPGLTPTDEMIETWAALHKEYAIFQLPYYAVPKGFLDAAMIASHRMVMDPGTFEREYCAKFTRDTNGFFPRSILDDASLEEVNYEVYGDPNCQYVMGLDPARHNDNFGLVVLKLVGGTAQCVYVESWNKAKFHESVVRIRSVLKRFPTIIKIAMDRGGGGDTIQELLANPKLVPEGQKPIIETDPSDDYKGIKDAQRILEMVNFHTWAIAANHALKSDFILKNVVFPSKLDDDYIMQQCALLINKNGLPFNEEDKEDLEKMAHISDLLYGTEDNKGNALTLGVYKELQEMLNEVCAIIQSVTEKGTETFGLSKISEQPEGLDIRRRDRYSALLLAAYAARVIRGQSFKMGYSIAGGTPSQILGDSTRNFTPMRRKGGVIY